MAGTDEIHTPDQRVRVFVSSTMEELAAERQAVRDAVTRLRLVPVMFELGARTHPAREVYRAYLAQSQIFVGIYWQSYGWVAPGEQVSGLEDEYLLAAGMPRLIYVKSPGSEREPRLAEMLARIEDEGGVSYHRFADALELQGQVENDLAVLLSERFALTRPHDRGAAEVPPASTLPVSLTPLVDRDREAAAAEGLVREEGVRLVTLTGPGGVGKSRLAVEIAGELAREFADGVRFVDLAAVPVAELVATEIAAGFGLHTSGSRLIGDLQAYLRERRLLLVLDNFEHVMGAAGLVSGLLAAAPGLVILVTSRTVLRLSGEHEFPVPTLPVPENGTSEDADDLQQYASVRLFTERAHTAAGFELTDANAATVAEICRRLDGLALALELAAARVRLLPPQALLARLDDRMGLLTAGPRDLPERQRTLRNTLAWSFELLSPAEQVLFARLGVFPGTFDLSAVEAIADDDAAADPGPAEQVIDSLSSLVDASLVQPQTSSGEPRFRLLETVREYALERLRDAADWREAHDRHAAYFAALAEPRETEHKDPGQLAWLDRLETEHDNLGATMSWLVNHDELERAISLGWDTWRYWWLKGHAGELRRVMEKLVAESRRLPPHQRALALSGAGFELRADGELARARQLFEQSLPLYEQAGDTLGAALVAAGLGRVLSLQHEDAEAGYLLEQALAPLRRAGAEGLSPPERVRHLLDVALLSNFLGQVRLSQGDQDGAAQLFTDGLCAARSAQDRFSILISLYDLALSSQTQGDLSGAVQHLKEGLSLSAETEDGSSAAYYLEALAEVARLQDDPQRAVRLLAAAGALLRAEGSGWLHAYVPRASPDDGVVATLRSSMGDEAFEQAWAWGESLSGSRAE